MGEGRRERRVSPAAMQVAIDRAAHLTVSQRTLRARSQALGAHLPGRLHARLSRGPCPLLPGTPSGRRVLWGVCAALRAATALALPRGDPLPDPRLQLRLHPFLPHQDRPRPSPFRPGFLRTAVTKGNGSRCQGLLQGGTGVSPRRLRGAVGGEGGAHVPFRGPAHAVGGRNGNPPRKGGFVRRRLPVSAAILCDKRKRRRRALRGGGRARGYYCL
mmetsp:Transcript_442/g.913  ORF Transcript_442/g.913 Transcript_442/m.913 type:complete len:216 (+) Transcript_442:1445-2092(+)